MGNHISTIIDRVGAVRRMLSRLLRRTPPPSLCLTDLPPEILHTILSDVYQNSFRDFCRTRKACRTLRNAARDEIYLRHVDLWTVPTPNKYLTGVQIFRLRCLEAENPSAIFLVGVHDFFRRGMMGGLAAIRTSAEAGYDLGIYALAHITRIMHPGLQPEEPLLNPGREQVRAAKRKVQNAPFDAWRYELPLDFIDMVDEIDVKEIYRCRCARTRSWPRPWDERVKRREMCDICFWRINNLWFAREFKKKALEWPQ